MILPIIQAPDARLLQPSLPVGMLSTVLGDLFGALIDTRIKHLLPKVEGKYLKLPLK